MKTTMNSKEGTVMTKYLSMINRKRKDLRQSDLINFFLALNMFILEVDVKTLMFRNYLGLAV